MSNRVPVQSVRNDGAIVADGDASPQLCDERGRVLVYGAGLLSVPLPTSDLPQQLSSTSINGGFLVATPGPVRLISVCAVNANWWSDGTPFYLVMWDAAPPSPVPGTIVLAVDPQTENVLSRDALGSSGWQFTFGAAWGWSQQPDAMVPIGGDPSTKHVHARFQFST